MRRASSALFSIVAGPLISRFSDRWSGLPLWWKPFNRDDVDGLTALIGADQVKPVIDRRFPLEDVVAALRYVDEGRATGKVIFTPQALPSRGGSRLTSEGATR